jgi:hypothetical protein
VHRHDYQLLAQGKAKLGVGRAEFRSDVTGECETVSFGVLHLGEHNLSGGIREYRGQEVYEATMTQIVDLFQNGDLPETSRMVFQNFDSGTYTLKLLFRDAQRRIMRTIMDSTLANAEAVYRTMYESQGPLILFVKALGLPLPNRIAIAAEFVLNSDLRREFDSDNPRISHVAHLLDDVRRTGVRLDEPTLEYAVRECIGRAAGRFRKWPQNIHALESFRRVVQAARLLPFEVDPWYAQNAYYRAQHSVLPQMTDGAWLEQFREVGQYLGFRID